MKFSEKVRKARQEIKMTQEELAKEIGVSLRTITNYETKNCYPRKRDTYRKLSKVLKVDQNYLMTEDEEFIMDAKDKYGPKGEKQAKDLLDEVTGLFAGGEMADEDLDVMMKAIQDAYWIAKEKNKKYARKD